MDDAVDLCPPEHLEALAQAISADPAAGLAAVDIALEDFPADPQLGFLRGSLLAGQGRYDEAHRALARVLELAPGYAIARFQYGLLLLSSGEPEAATTVWAPLRRGAPDDPLRLFAEGLDALARDAFVDAERLLRQGIAVNQAWPVVSDDMRKVLEGIATLKGEAEPLTSSVDWLLRASAARTEH